MIFQWMIKFLVGLSRDQISQPDVWNEAFHRSKDSPECALNDDPNTSAACYPNTYSLLKDKSQVRAEGAEKFEIFGPFKASLRFMASCKSVCFRICRTLQGGETSSVLASLFSHRLGGLIGRSHVPDAHFSCASNREL